MIRCVSQVAVLSLMKSIARKVLVVFGIIAQLDIFTCMSLTKQIL